MSSFVSVHKLTTSLVLVLTFSYIISPVCMSCCDHLSIYVWSIIYVYSITLKWYLCCRLKVCNWGSLLRLPLSFCRQNILKSLFLRRLLFTVIFMVQRRQFWRLVKTRFPRSSWATTLIVVRTVFLSFSTRCSCEFKAKHGWFVGITKICRSIRSIIFWISCKLRFLVILRSQRHL